MHKIIFERMIKEVSRCSVLMYFYTDGCDLSQKFGYFQLWPYVIALCYIIYIIVLFSFLLAYICHLTVYINCKILLAFSSSSSCSSSRYYTKSFNTCTAHVIIWLNFFSWICFCHPPLSDICCLLCTVLPPHPLWMYLLLVLFDICTITSPPALFGHNLILYNMSTHSL